VLEEFIN